VVPRFAKEHPHVKCDLLSVDGGHFYEIAIQDLRNMRALANPLFHVAVMDDTNTVQRELEGINQALNELEDRLEIRVLQRLVELRAFNGFLRGLSVFQYALDKHV
jgi:restriction endonuclease Mrr